MFKLIKHWLYIPIYIYNIGANLTQIYGELNRIRLIIGEESDRGKKIEAFDRKYNKYYPYFGSKKSEKKYTTTTKGNY